MVTGASAHAEVIEPVDIFIVTPTSQSNEFASILKRHEIFTSEVDRFKERSSGKCSYDGASGGPRSGSLSHSILRRRGTWVDLSNLIDNSLKRCNRWAEIA